MKYILLLLILMVLIPVNVLAKDYYCPEYIETDQKLKSTPSQNWQWVIPPLEKKQYFEGISIYSGHPKNGVSLVEDNEVSSKEPYWTFSEIDKSEIWMGCRYNGSVIVLVQELPTTTKKCTLKNLARAKDQRLLVCQ